MGKSTKKSAERKNRKAQMAIAVVAAIIVCILAISYGVAKANKVELEQLVLNGDITLEVGESQAVSFNVATAKVQDNDLVVAAVNKLDLVWSVGQ